MTVVLTDINEEHHGPLHALVNAAESDPGTVASDLSPAGWERAVAINLGGVLNLL